MSSTAKFDDYTHIVPPVKSFLVTGGTAGNHTVTGITTADKILSVLSTHIDATSLSTVAFTVADLTSEFTIDSDDTVDNDSGTDTTGALLLVAYADYDA